LFDGDKNDGGNAIALEIEFDNPDDQETSQAWEIKLKVGNIITELS
jgi:hypothetical protein